MHTLIECLLRGLREQDIGPDGGQDGYAGYDDEEGATFFHGVASSSVGMFVFVSSVVFTWPLPLDEWGACFSARATQASPPPIRPSPAPTEWGVSICFSRWVGGFGFRRSGHQQVMPPRSMRRPPSQTRGTSGLTKTRMVACDGPFQSARKT